MRMLPAMLALLAAVACSSEKPGEPEPVTRGDDIDIELDVKVPGSGYSMRPTESRAEEPDDYTPATYPTEDLVHLRVIIVDDATGEIAHNRGILFSNGKPVADNMRFKVKSSADYTLYLIGNCENAGDNLDFGIDNLPVGSIYPAGLIENTELECPDGVILYDNTGSAKTYLPMSEKFQVTTEEYTGALGQTQLLPLFITRAASKFAFTISAAEDYTDGESPALTSIQLNGLTDKEYFLPRDAIYNPDRWEHSYNKYEGREIISFSAPGDLTYSSKIFDLPAPLQIEKGMTPYEWNPELYFSEVPLTPAGLTCTLSFDNGANMLVPIKLPNLPYGMPRNTLVKIDIIIGNNNAIVLDLQVLPWNQYVSEFNYSDEVNIASDGALSFIAGTYNGLDKTTGRLVLNDYPSATTGTFGIATPAGMRWDAYLLTESGATDAILFKLPDGTQSNTISGIIGAESKELFQIVAANPAGDTPNTAILQVVVTTADGRGVSANILNGAGYGSDVKYLTIIQNPK